MLFSLQLLKIFVFEKLSAYKSFHEANMDYLSGLGMYTVDEVCCTEGIYTTMS